MKDVIDFVLAALPWIAIGVTIIIASIDMHRKKGNKNKSEQDKKVDDDYMTSGLCFGMAIGIAIGVSLKNQLGENALAIGMSLGMLIGTISGTKIKR